MEQRPRINDPHPYLPAQISEHVYHSQLYPSLQSEYAAEEENQTLLQQQMEDFSNQNALLRKEIAQIKAERDSLQDKVRTFEANLKEKEQEFVKKLDQDLGGKEELKKEVEDLKERIQKLESEKEERNRLILKTLESFSSTKDCLVRIIEGLELDEDKDETGVKESEGIFPESELDEESRALFQETTLVARLATEVESRMDKYKELRKKDKRELENSLISLTEENRDINKLLRIALLEKESVEKRLKGHDHKRAPLLQFAERGLRVGFGFMMGGGNNEQPTESSVASTGNKSDSSECEEEVVSLASTVESIMKNLRLEITQLRRSLEESRSETERLQCLTEKQAKDIAENKLYIKELEDRERVLAQNVEEFLMEIKEAEEEVARWKKACELEVEAGKNEIEERDKVQELQKTKAALDMSNGKLRLKEELASTAMAAQAAAERSLQLADSRAVGLRQQIEQLTKQLEEAEKRERNSHKIRQLPCFKTSMMHTNIDSTRLKSGSIARSNMDNASF
ncbi:hypothetical protein L6164_006042 [Bauhinia variegata]|uniref:Uncharacterized protein n=1 Tax=Bauhinia variegata TaxID=167791 RepID=A0ACB9PT99_BAUVA|nr:hypothetical protein L6164_006042 [Bauhinia variegata]